MALLLLRSVHDDAILLLMLLQMGTDIREAQRCRRAANCPLAIAFRLGAQRTIRHLLECSSSSRSGSSDNNCSGCGKSSCTTRMSSCCSSSLRHSNSSRGTIGDADRTATGIAPAEQQQQQQHCLFVGMGDCSSLLDAARMNSAEQTKRQRSDAPLSFTCLPLFKSSALCKQEKALFTLLLLHTPCLGFGTYGLGISGAGVYAVLQWRHTPQS